MDGCVDVVTADDDDDDAMATTTTTDARDDDASFTARGERRDATSDAAESSASADAGATTSTPPVNEFRARYDRVRDDACAVSSIEIRGNERTRASVIERELARAYEARTLDGIKDALFAANARLYEYGIFKDVAIVIDADHEGGRLDGGDVPGAKVVVSVEEKDAFHFKVGTYVSKRGEGEAEATFGLRNPLGYGEKFEVELIKGQNSSSTYSAAWEQPKLYGSDVNLDARAFQSVECFKKLSSFDVTSRGIRVGVAGDGPGTVDYEIAWRDVQDPTRMASREVRRQLGHSLKSAVTHTYVSDRLDRQVRPTSGYLWKIRSELAGIGFMDNALAAKFVKSEVSAHVVETLDASRGITASASGRFGVLFPWGKSGNDGDSRTCIADRFFLGGVGCLRQFENNGVGPSDARRGTKKTAAAEESPGAKTPSSAEDGEPSLTRDALGGDFVWSATAALQMDIPGEKFEAMREAGIHFHAFATAGTLLPLAALSGAPKDAIKVVRDATRASLGVGIVWPLPIGQIEMNYGKVVRAGTNDRVSDGFQVGIAAHVSM